MSQTLTKKGQPKMSKDNDKVVKPKIPLDILDSFLADKIEDKNKSKITKISDHFLWKGNDIERHRINVWMEEKLEGYYCSKVYIGYSWFVHYYNYTKTIVDQTV